MSQVCLFGFVKQAGLEFIYHPSWNGNPLVFSWQVLQLQAWTVTVTPPAFPKLYLSVCLSICVHMWRPEERIRCPCLSFSAYFIEARSLFEPGAHTFLDRLGANKPHKIFGLCLPWSWSYRHVQDDWLVMWVLKLEFWSPWLQGKCAKFWTTSSAFQSLVF